MKKKLLSVLALLLAFGGGTGLGWYVRSQTMNPLSTIPKMLEPFLGFLIQEGKQEDDDLLYYDTDLADFIANGSKKTKVAVEAVVAKIAKQPDGDYHIILRPENPSAKVYLVAEAIPEIKLSLPKEGDRVKIWGITRFDVLHNWWELHPVVGWEKK